MRPLSPRLRNLLRLGCLYPAFFVLFFVVGVYWTFPYGHLKEFLIQEVTRSGQVRLVIESLSPSWVTGVTARGVEVTMDDGSIEGPIAPLVIPRATARLSLLSLLTGWTDVGYDVELSGGGRAVGRYAQSDTGVIVEADLEQVDLRRLPPLRTATGIPFTGRLEGTVDLSIGEEPENTEGTADLSILGLSVFDGQTPLKIPGMAGAGLTLEPMRLGTLELQLAAEEGIATIDRLQADGPDAGLVGEGALRLLRPPTRSTIDAFIEVEFKDEYRTSSDRMTGLFAVLEANPAVRPARTPDGHFRWRIQGSLGGSLRTQPAGNR
ncbi:MAG: type II secretion system protein GspN [Sandaracinaceae bacterium]